MSVDDCHLRRALQREKDEALTKRHAAQVGMTLEELRSRKGPKEQQKRRRDVIFQLQAEGLSIHRIADVLDRNEWTIWRILSRHHD